MTDVPVQYKKAVDGNIFLVMDGAKILLAIMEELGCESVFIENDDVAVEITKKRKREEDEKMAKETGEKNAERSGKEMARSERRQIISEIEGLGRTWGLVGDQPTRRLIEKAIAELLGKL